VLSRAVPLVVAVIALGATAVEARDIYDDAALRRTQASHQRTTQRIFDEVVLPAMTEAEKSQLGAVPPIDFPLRPAGDSKDYPLAFYVPPHRRAITMPIASLKFLDDICTAYAWLQINGYSLETISEYSAMLRFANEPPGGFPAPLEALGIPANALDDKQVDNLALGHFVTARTFLLAHELGHVLYAHRGGSMEHRRQNEIEADRFAFRLMGRTVLPPIGALLFFMADAHWSYLEENPQATHPMSGSRVEAAAQWVDDPAFAQQLRQLGRLLDDPDIRYGFVATGKAGDFSALAPRRPGEPPRSGAMRTGSAAATGIFQGRYSGHFTQQPDPAEIPVEVVLERNGDRVTGWYSFGLGIGRIDGKVAGGRLDFDWEWAGNTGRGVLRAPDANSFEGTWGYRESADGAGVWFGAR
jgi:hypothetical protein